MVAWPRPARWAAAACCALVLACGGEDGHVGVGNADQAIRAARPGVVIDPAWQVVPAVGALLNSVETGAKAGSGSLCSGTLISRRDVLTAAHCHGYTTGFVRPGLPDSFRTPVLVQLAGHSELLVRVTGVLAYSSLSTGEGSAPDLAVVRLATEVPAFLVPEIPRLSTAGGVPDGARLLSVGFGCRFGDDTGVKRAAIHVFRGVGWPQRLAGAFAYPGSGILTETFVTTLEACEGDSGGGVFTGFPWALTLSLVMISVFEETTGVVAVGPYLDRIRAIQTAWDADGRTQPRPFDVDEFCGRFSDRQDLCSHFGEQCEFVDCADVCVRKGGLAAGTCLAQ